MAYSGSVDLFTAPEPERGKFNAETNMTLGFVHIDDLISAVEGFHLILDIRIEILLMHTRSVLVLARTGERRGFSSK